MSRLLLAAFALLAAVAAAQGPAARADEQRNPCLIAGLEGAAESGGIGGTGIMAQEGGIGGTGIVGTITGFASICVNGVEVQYGDAVPVTWNGLPSTASQLAVGQVVTAQVDATATGLEARSIAILAAVAGPIRSRDAAAILVLGQRVLLATRTRAVDERGRAIPLFALKAGEAVIVSGLRRPDGAIVASRIERARTLARTGVAPDFSFPPAVRRLWLEGYVERYSRGDAVQLLGRTMQLTATTRLDGVEPLAGLHAYVLATLAPDGALRAERIVVPAAGQVPPAAPRDAFEDGGLELPGRGRIPERSAPRETPRPGR